MKNLIKAIEESGVLSPLSKDILKFFLVIQTDYQVQRSINELCQILGVTRNGFTYALESLKKLELIKWDKAYKLRTFYLNEAKLKELENLYLSNQKFKKATINKKITPL